MKDEDKLAEALRLIIDVYEARSDKEDPWHGGVMPNKTKRRYRRLIDTLNSMVSGKATK